MAKGFNMIDFDTQMFSLLKQHKFNFINIIYQPFQFIVNGYYNKHIPREIFLGLRYTYYNDNIDNNEHSMYMIISESMAGENGTKMFYNESDYMTYLSTILTEFSDYISKRNNK